MVSKLPLPAFSSRPLSNAAIPTAWLGMILSALVIPFETNAATFTSSRADLGGNDVVDWSVVGSIFSPLGPPDPSVFLPSTFSVASQAGRSVQVNIPESTVPGVLPPFVFQTTPAPGIETNFGNGDFILFTGLIPGPPPAIGNPGPITLVFPEPVFGAGAQFAVDDTFNFLGTIAAFDSSDQLLGSFSAPGTSSLALDNSAAFFGIRDEEARIAKLEFSSSVSASALGINQLSLVTDVAAVPEPSSLLGLTLIGILGYVRRRK